MSPEMWTYIYLKALAFAMVCLIILSIPYAASLEPGDGIPGRWFLYTGVMVFAGYLIGLSWIF